MVEAGQNLDPDSENKKIDLHFVRHAGTVYLEDIITKKFNLCKTLFFLLGEYRK